MSNRRLYYKQYNLKNKKRRNEYSRKYWKLHKKSLTLYKKLKKRNNILFRITCNLRTRINVSLRKNLKSAHTFELIGCSIKFLKSYLESKFQKGMSWSNYGYRGWHIDHIKPCALFDLSKPEEQRKCFHYTNLQPLWAEDNWQKSRKEKQE